MTGECFELWKGTAEANAEYIKEAAVEHAKKAVAAQTKLETAKRELEQNWSDICKEKEAAKKSAKLISLSGVSTEVKS